MLHLEAAQIVGHRFFPHQSRGPQDDVTVRVRFGRLARCTFGQERLVVGKIAQREDGVLGPLHRTQEVDLSGKGQEKAYEKVTEDMDGFTNVSGDIKAGVEVVQETLRTVLGGVCGDT